MIERVERADRAGRVVVATTNEPEDDPIVELARSEGWLSFRGSTDDVLDRHHRAAEAFDADLVVKIPSDCPLIDPEIIDRVIGHALQSGADYVSNLHPPTWPDGNDVEVMTSSALATAWREADRPLEREHTTPFLWEHPERFEVLNLEWDRDLSMTHRWVLDYPEDLEFVRAVYERLYPQSPEFGTDDVLGLLDDHPELHELNAHLAGVNWYRHHLDELTTVGREETRRAPGEDS